MRGLAPAEPVCLFVLGWRRVGFKDKYQFGPTRQYALTPALSQKGEGDKNEHISHFAGLDFSISSSLFSKARIRFGKSPSFLKTAIARQKALTSNAGVPTST